jgi:hypothetical protein
MTRILRCGVQLAAMKAQCNGGPPLCKGVYGLGYFIFEVSRIIKQLFQLRTRLAEGVAQLVECQIPVLKVVRSSRAVLTF